MDNDRNTYGNKLNYTKYIKKQPGRPKKVQKNIITNNQSKLEEYFK